MANPNERILNLQREPLNVGAGGAVNSVNGQTGDVVLTAEDVGALPDSTVIPTKTSDLENDSDYQTGDEVNQAIGLETTARENADNSLQGQIDALSAASDVTDIVGTYADLQAYDTSKLKDNDIIKVLQDENQNDETTYYRWSISTETFTLIGEEGPYYTKAAADQKFQDKLTAGSNITIDANNEISASGIPTTATFWGASYDSVNNKVDGALTVIDNGQPSSFGSSSIVGNTSPTGFYTQSGSVKINTSNSYGTIGFGKGSNIMGQFSWGGNLASSHLEMRCPIRMSAYTTGNNRNKITFLGDPTDQYDAATKNYVDTQVGNIETILQSINSGQGVGV